MKIARFRVNGKMGYGLVERDRIARINRNPYGKFKATGETYSLSQVKLLPPTVPRVFYAAGLNYRKHAEWASQALGRQMVPDKHPQPGYRAPNAIIGPDEPIVIPKDAKEVHYEGELAVVIGRKARNVSEKNALSYILGYTICNDVSERTWQVADSTLWRAKNSDTFKPLGPWIATDIDPLNVGVTTRINEKAVHQYNTKSMVFGPATYISVMSRFVTLQPGDLLIMGVEGAPGPIKPGDVVEIEIAGIGILRNPVVQGR